MDIEVECMALDDELGETPGELDHLFLMRPVERFGGLIFAP